MICVFSESLTPDTTIPETTLKVQEWLVNVDPSTNNNTDRETDDDQATPNTVISLSSLNFIEICTE